VPAVVGDGGVADTSLAGGADRRDLPPAADARSLSEALTRAGRELGVDVTVRRVENDEL